MTARETLTERRNRLYFSEMHALSESEIYKRTEIATATEIVLIELFDEMRKTLEISLENFLGNYGHFSDRLNIIYNTADNAVFGVKTPLSEAFSERRRRSFGEILPVTVRRLYKLRERHGDELIAGLAAWLFSAARAETAARDNTNALCNCSQLDDLQRQGYKYKEWRTVMDGKERHDHAVANGQIVPVDSPFIVGGYRMMFPKDDTYGAPLNEIINCRCMISGR